MIHLIVLYRLGVKDNLNIIYSSNFLKQRQSRNKKI